MTILQEVNAYLLTKLTPYATVQLDVFPGNSHEEIIIRTQPSQAVETRYMDGSRAGQFQFSYYAKSENTETPRQQLDAIIDALDLPGMEQISEATLAKIEVVSSTVLVSKTENGEYIYSAGFRLDYIKGGQ